MQKRIYISIPLLFLMLGAFSQTTNPFDLKWRSGNSKPGTSEEAKNDTQIIAFPMADTVGNVMNSAIADPTSSDSADVKKTAITTIDNVADVAKSHDSERNSSASGVSGSRTPVPDDSDLNEVLSESSDLADHSAENTPSTEADADGRLPDDASSAKAKSGEPVLYEPESTTAPEEKASAAEGRNDSEEVESVVSDDESSASPIRLQRGAAGNIGIGLFLILFGLALVILIWAVNINRGFIQKIYRAALNENFSALLLREQRFASSQYLYYIVYGVFFLNGGLFLYLMSRYAIWDFGHRTTPVIMFLLFLSLVYIVKHFVTRLIGETFQISKEMRHYNFNIILYNTLAGIALMPVNLFLAFGPINMRMPLIYIGLAIIAFMYIIRQFRGIIMGSHLIVKNSFQFFVYLCAIEILPVLVLFKFFPN